ncbi:coproporphyrinogen-III oxidase family protein [Silvanigrella paludirubra]|nr:radical SAM protein [Silvanigrella paludirubra]
MIDILSQKATIGFYFHIPFCPHICPYCDFIKTSKFTKKDIIEYFNELKIQLKFFIDNIPEYHNKHITVYFGGGTPGLFEASYYKELFDILNSFFYIEEATLETNPLTNLERRFEDYLNVGFNRITLGAQSLCSNALKILGRKHTPENILNNIKWAKNAGFKNIQVDLIYGLKNGVRTISVKDEIESLYEAGSSGISAYALTIEKRTLFAKTDFANDDIAVQEYYEILSKCKSIGFQQHETSNFSSLDTKHNNIYWYGMPYIGIGTGSHGLLPSTKEYPYGIRYKIGEESEASYAPGNDKLIFSDKNERMKNFSIHYETPRSKQDYISEMIFTLLRTPNGIPLDWLKLYSGNNDILNILLNNSKINRAIHEGKILFSERSISLSPEEKIRGDSWVADFISLI